MSYSQTATQSRPNHFKSPPFLPRCSNEDEPGGLAQRNDLHEQSWGPALEALWRIEGRNCFVSSATRIG